MPALAVSAAAIAKPHKAARHAATKPAVVKPAAPQLEAHVLPAASPDLLPDMSLGNPNAPVTVIEYASAACPHCAHWNAEVWPQFQAKYVTTGKVRYIFREVLTNPQEYAVSAFLVGRCAVKRAKDPTSSAPYFAVVDSYFRNQQAYFTDHNIGAATAEVKAKTGMTPADITACIGDGPSF
ncbi:MAG: thioredoxin domain-containing protein, partial [Asticcacaulis sp.]|nr:thioredoxin domain-containing protein [Asticcacaulis sp.]